MAKCIKIDNLSSIKGQKVFLDANIWVYLFCEISYTKPWLIKKYSSAFHFLLKNKVGIFIDFSIMSEFVNRYLRIAFSNYKELKNIKKMGYKDYRKTDDFREAWENVSNIVNERILPNSTIVNYEYDNFSLSNLLKVNNLDVDFNDNHIVNLCSSNNLALLTHDGDFKNSDITVITANNVYR